MSEFVTINEHITQTVEYVSEQMSALIANDKTLQQIREHSTETDD